MQILFRRACVYGLVWPRGMGPGLEISPFPFGGPNALAHGRAAKAGSSKPARRTLFQPRSGRKMAAQDVSPGCAKRPRFLSPFGAAPAGRKILFRGRHPLCRPCRLTAVQSFRFQVQRLPARPVWQVPGSRRRLSLCTSQIPTPAVKRQVPSFRFQSLPARLKGGFQVNGGPHFTLCLSLQRHLGSR